MPCPSPEPRFRLKDRYCVCTPSRWWLEVIWITACGPLPSTESTLGLVCDIVCVPLPGGDWKWCILLNACPFPPQNADLGLKYGIVCVCPFQDLAGSDVYYWMHALSLPRQSMVLCVCTPSSTWLEVMYITVLMPFLSPEPQPGVEGRCGPAGLSWLPDQQQEGPAPLGAGAAPGIPDLQWRLPHPPHLPTLEQHRGTGPLCSLLSVCLSLCVCAAWEGEWLRHRGDRLISPPACTDETHHSFDCQLYMTAWNHFYSENSHLL